ncbi:MAG TPA: hypothetical protein VF678_00685 [bacterium]
MTARARSFRTVLRRLRVPALGPRRHALLLALACGLLLSGCMLSPLLQAPAAVMAGVAVLLGLAACGPDDGSGDAGGDASRPYVVRMDALAAGQPGNVVAIRGVDNGYADGLGVALAVGSVRGDGVQDLVIGAPRTFTDLGSAGAYSTGRAYVVFGGAGLRGWNGAGAAPIESVVSGGGGFTLRTNVRFNRLGYSVAIASNLAGDGQPAVLVGLDGVDGAGAVAAVRPQGEGVALEAAIGATALEIVNAYQVSGVWQAGRAPTDTLLFNGFGAAVTALDLDGDGLTDVAAAAPRTTGLTVCDAPGYDASTGTFFCIDGTQSLTFPPGVFIVMGAPGLSRGAFDLDDPTPDFTGAPNSFTGVAMARGNVNGDRFADLIVGAMNPTAPGASGSGPGGVHVVFGAPNGAIATTPGALHGGNGFTVVDSGPYASLLGWQVAAGDVNGDGLDDVILSEMALVTPQGGGTDAQALLPTGRVWVVFGQRGGMASGIIDLATLPASEGFSITLPTFSLVDSITTGDLNGDGIPDVVIGSSLATELRQPDERAAYAGYNGAVFVAFGSANPVSLTATELSGSRGMVVLGPPQGIVGATVAVADLDGDGWDDLVIASPKGTYQYANSYSDPDLTLTHRGPGAMLPYHGPGLVYVLFGPGEGGAWPGSVLGGDRTLFGLPLLSGPALQPEAATPTAATPQRTRAERFLARLKASMDAAAIWGPASR